MDWAPNFRTESLLVLESYKPLDAQVHVEDCARIVTPLKLRVWERGPSSHPDQDFVQFVCNGIREGFREGFDYRNARCKRSPGNMKFVK